MSGKTALDTSPQSVAVVALGPSNQDYVSARAKKRDMLDPEEIWTINSAAQCFACDKAFVMDDLKRVNHEYPQWGSWLKTTKLPIVTCYKYKDFPSSVAYPRDEVIEFIKDDLLTTTVAYVIAYAMYKRVRELYLFGCDFWYPGSIAVEGGIGAVAYLLGRAREMGMTYRIPQGSTLLDAHLSAYGENGKRPLYGYDWNPGDANRAIQNGTATPLQKAVANQAPRAMKGELNAESAKGN